MVPFLCLKGGHATSKEAFAEGDAPSSGQYKEEESASVRFPKIHGEESWETLQKRFPHHATEEKLAQFQGVPIKRNKASLVSRNLCLCCHLFSYSLLSLLNAKL